MELGTALIDFYAKCGYIELAEDVFGRMDCKDVAAWSVMVSGLGTNGKNKMAIELFEEMEQKGPVPNDITFVAVLVACNHKTLVNEVWRLLGRMSKVYGIRPSIEHYGCMVDPLTRSGQLKGAEILIRLMPMELDGAIWGSFLQGCLTHGEIDLAESPGKRLLDTEEAAYSEAVMKILTEHRGHMQRVMVSDVDPKEKAKSKTRDWLNNTVSELESQIDSFEAEIEGLSVKKGKTRPPRLTHLESSINRHKAHIMKLELILRLLDNDELSPEEVNDVKDFLDDYVERNQEDFDEFDDVDMLYNTLPLDKVESLEDLVTIGPPAPVKAAVASSHHQHGDSIQKQVAEKAPQEGISEFGGRNPPPKISAVASAPPSPAGTHATPVAIAASSVHSGPSSAKSVLDNSTSSVPSLPKNNAVKGVLDNSISSVPSLPMNNAVKGVLDNSISSVPSLPMNNVVKEEDNSNFPGRKPSPALPEAGLMNLGRSAANPLSVTIPSTSGSIVSSNGSLGVASETPRRAMLGADDRLGGSGIGRPLVSSSSIRMMLPQAVKTSEAVSSGNGETGGVTGRMFSGVSGIQWRPGNPSQSQNEGVPLRTEIAPDHREQFLQRYQQAQQQGLNLKLFTTQQNPLQQFNSRSSTPSVGGPAPGLINATSTQQHASSIHSQSGQHTLMATGSKDADVGHVKADVPQQHQSLTDDSATSSVLHKYTANEGDSKVSNTSVTQAGVSGSVTEPAQVTHDIDVSPHQSSQSTQTASLGVIGRRSVPDLGAIWDSLSGLATLDTSYDPQTTMQLLESSFRKLPQPKDSERANYTPRHPTVTPKSYPQVQAPIVSNPTFWERLGSDNVGTDTLFFAFYCQQNTYQQYLAAKELKKQSWRYHKEYNTWFQRHEEPKVSTDDFEQGTYVYFDFHMGNDEMQNGWCQRIKTDFKFEYQFLEDELVV